MTGARPVGPPSATPAAVLRSTIRRLRGGDVALTSAGATLYGALAAVPSMLV